MYFLKQVAALFVPAELKCNHWVSFSREDEQLCVVLWHPIYQIDGLIIPSIIHSDFFNFKLKASGTADGSKLQSFLVDIKIQ